MDRLVSRAYKVCDWFSKFVILNLLWLLFVLIGLVIFGIMPATVAVFTVVRKWIVSDTEIPIFKTFLKTYKKEFFHSNILGLCIAAVSLFLLYDLKLVLSIGGTIQTILGVPLFIIIGFYLITLLYLLPVYVHFDLKFQHYFKYAFYLSILNIHTTILIVIMLILLGAILSFLPGFIPFIAVSIFSFIVMYGAKIAFQRTEMKQQKYHTQNESVSKTNI